MPSLTKIMVDCQGRGNMNMVHHIIPSNMCLVTVAAASPPDGKFIITSSPWHLYIWGFALLDERKCLGLRSPCSRSLPLPFSLSATLSLMRRRRRWRRAAAFRWLASSAMAFARMAAACRRCSTACSARAQHSCSCCMRASAAS